ncbi:MAG: NUDIX hydrolase [Candidatus Wallbacteria bacterium]|nr:NUDIX hydrolase [Candidatus Wallbacteria bacterium]
MRPAVGRALVELPAGHLEPGESPDAGARRELEEETGYTAAEWRLLARFYPSCGKLSEQMHLFEARGLTPGRSRPEPNEDLEVVTATVPEALQMARRGDIADSKTLLGLLLAAGAGAELT